MDENFNPLKQTNGQYDTKDVIDVLVILTKWRKFIIINCLIVTIGAAAVSLMMPKWYAATASVIPPQKKGGLFEAIPGFASAFQNFSKTWGKLNTASEGAYQYLTILKSRTVMEKVIREYNLRQVYDIDESAPIENVIAALGKQAYFAVHEEGNVTVTVYDKSPQRAADMANSFVKTLNDLSIELGTREAKNNREFIERGYRQAQSNLRAAEDSLKKFQEKYGMYAMPEQTKAAINAAAALKSQILIKEIEVGVLVRVLAKQAPELQRARLELSEMNKKLAEMKYGTENWREEKTLRLFVPFNDVPELGMEYIRLYRDFEIKNKLLGFLLPIYEQAKIEEQKNIPVLLVLDKAVPAERKSRPRRSLIVLFASCASLFLGIIAALWYEAFQRMKADPERYHKIQQGIISPLRKSLPMFAKERQKL
jgi:uncharacterized protein involved in exopolysaccharide biosynthesis